MAVTVAAPLAAQLFALGGASDVGGKDQQFKGNVDARPRGFSTGSGSNRSAGEGGDSGDKRLGLLGNLAGMAIGAYMGQETPTTEPAEDGTGYGLGGTLVGGDANNPSYAQTEGPSLKTLFSSTPEPEINPADNGYRDDNPYAIDYRNNPTKKTLFTYGGSYGGSTY